jgi:hypothetical protein
MYEKFSPSHSPGGYEQKGEKITYSEMSTITTLQKQILEHF